MEKSSTIVQGWKMQVRKKQVQFLCANMENASTENEVEMLAQASTDGATVDGSRCETDITKHTKTCELKK